MVQINVWASDPPFLRQLSAADLLEQAWGIIANANEGNWDGTRPDWHSAALDWRDAYFRHLDRTR